MRHCPATSLTLLESTDNRDSSDKLAAVTFAYTALSDSCQSIVCSIFRVTIQLLRDSGIHLSPMSVHCGTIDRFHNANKTCRARDVSFLSNLGPVLSVRIGYARFATCRPRGLLYMSLV
jgi:hypothetical protein